MARARRIESIFLNIPYDSELEDLYIAYIVGLMQLGRKLNVTLAVPNQGRLNTIIDLIERSTFPSTICHVSSSPTDSTL